MKFLSLIILALFYIAQFPFSAAGYIATWIAAFWFFGVSKANKHQDFMIALSDKRNKPGDRSSE
jgi:hypothetical protein